MAYGRQLMAVGFLDGPQLASRRVGRGSMAGRTADHSRACPASQPAGRDVWMPDLLTLSCSVPPTDAPPHPDHRSGRCSRPRLHDGQPLLVGPCTDERPDGTLMLTSRQQVRLPHAAHLRPRQVLPEARDGARCKGRVRGATGGRHGESGPFCWQQGIGPPTLYIDWGGAFGIWRARDGLGDDSLRH